MDVKPSLTPRAKKAIKRSFDIANSLCSDKVLVEHLFLSLLHLKSGPIVESLDHFGLNRIEMADLLEDELTSTSLEFEMEEEEEEAVLSKELIFSIDLAYNYASELNHEYTGPEHLLVGIIGTPDSSVAKLFEALDISIKEVQAKIEDCFHFSSPNESSKDNLQHHQQPSPPQTSSKSLDTYGTNYNVLAMKNSFNKLISKDGDLNLISEILCRKQKNNPILIGEPGVGKTALIEGLANSIVDSSCCDYLIPKVIYEINMGYLVSGTKYRGQFEERLKSIISEASKNPNVILFIDEIHTLMGAGSAEGSVDAASMLKPVLARGEISCIGATTFEDYKKTIQKDGALDRRFQPVYVSEPSKSETLKIISGIIDNYEKFHGVSYRSDIIELAVDLSDKYVRDKKFPDKAIDIIDQAGSKAKLRCFRRPEEARNLEVKLDKIMNKGSKCSQKEQESIFSKYQKILEDWSEESSLKKFSVKKKDIYDVISYKSNVPISELSTKDVDKILKLEKFLNKEVVGQTQASELVTKTILRNKAGLIEESRPMGSFLFLGSTGIGKTLMAKKVSQHMFGGQSNLIHLDMTEFSEKASVSRLIGASPGYVGYEEGGFLTEQVRKNPHSVILFDEVEKAHPEVIQLLLQILDEGRLKDNFGKVSSFANSIIVMTANIGAEVYDDKFMGFGEKNDTSDSIKDDVKKTLRSTFKPELIGRIGEIVVFNQLDEQDIIKIINIELNKVKATLFKKGINLSFTKSVSNFLLKDLSIKNSGARDINNVIKNKVLDFLAPKVIKKELSGEKVVVYSNKKELKVRN